MKTLLPSLLLASLLLSACVSTESEEATDTTSEETSEEVHEETRERPESDEESTEGIRVISPTEGTSVNSGFTMEAMIPGNWSYEATIDFRLESMDGELIAVSTATTSEDWMTTDPVLFSGEIIYNITADTTAKIVIVKANPSGLPENADSYEWTIELIADEASDMQTIEHTMLGISLEAPLEFSESERSISSLGIYFWGETQIEGSEFFDGVSMRFEKANTGFSRMTNLKEFAQDELVETSMGAEVISISSSLSTTTIAGKTAYSFSYTGLGEFTVYMFKNQAGDVIKLRVAHPDPEGNGYEEIVEQIIESIALI